MATHTALRFVRENPCALYAMADFLIPQINPPTPPGRPFHITIPRGSELLNEEFSEREIHLELFLEETISAIYIDVETNKFYMTQNEFCDNFHLYFSTPSEFQDEYKMFVFNGKDYLVELFRNRIFEYSNKVFKPLDSLKVFWEYENDNQDTIMIYGLHPKCPIRLIR